jgi:hypothetical protein
LREQFVSALTIGLAVVAVAVGVVFFMQRGAHVALTGPMTVRIHATDKDTALAIINLHLTNPSDYGFQVSDVTSTLETKAGESTTRIVSKVDAQRLFEAMPELGPFHATLYTKYVIPPHSTADYTLLAQYSLPESMLTDRQRFVVRIQEINGKAAEIAERP